MTSQKHEVTTKSRKSASEFAALYMDRINFLLVWLFWFLVFLSMAALYFSNSTTDIKLVQTIFGWTTGILVFSCMGFNFFVVCRVIPRIRNLSNAAKYNALRIYPIYRNLLLIATIFLFAYASSIQILANAFPSFFLFTAKYVQILNLFPTIILLFASLQQMCFVDMDSWNRNTQLQLSFDILTDCDSVASQNTSKHRKMYPSEAWSYCIRQIVFGLEDRFKRVISVSGDFDKNFYEPFNTVTLAGVLGSPEEQDYAKKWVSELGHTVTDKDMQLNQKYTLILEHLEKAKKEEKMKRFQEFGTKYGFRFNFIHGTKNLNKTLRKILYIVGGIVGILAAIKAFL